MTYQLKESLEKQEICPKCQADWLKYKKMINVSDDDPRWYEAVIAIRKCPVCIDRFEGQVKIIGINRG